MSKWNLLGLVSIIGGFVSVMFQAISSMMTTGDIIWNSKTPIDLLGEGAFAWVDGISVSLFRNILDILVNTQVFILLFGLGVLLIVAGMFFKK